MVKAWNDIPPEAISNAFIHNGWEQALNGNGTKVLHGTLREIVENNSVRGIGGGQHHNRGMMLTLQRISLTKMTLISTVCKCKMISKQLQTEHTSSNIILQTTYQQMK